MAAEKIGQTEMHGVHNVPKSEFTFLKHPLKIVPSQLWEKKESPHRCSCRDQLLHSPLGERQQPKGPVLNPFNQQRNALEAAKSWWAPCNKSDSDYESVSA